MIPLIPSEQLTEFYQGTTVILGFFLLYTRVTKVRLKTENKYLRIFLKSSNEELYEQIGGK